MPKKFIRNLIIGIVLLLVVVIAVILLVVKLQTASDPAVIEAKLQQERAEWGYTAKVAQLQDIYKIEDWKAEELLNLFLEKVPVGKIDSIEKGGIKGNGTIYSGGYKFDIMVYGGELNDVWIKDVVLFSMREMNSNTIEKRMSFNEYNEEVTQLAKFLEVDKSIAVEIYSTSTEIGIYSLKYIKKVKDKSNPLNKYSVDYNKIPLTYYIDNNGVLNTIELDMLGTKVQLYTLGMADIRLGHIRNYVPLNQERIAIRDSLTIIIPINMGIQGAKLILPVALPEAGDDLQIFKDKDSGLIYIKTVGELTKPDESKSKEYDFEIRLDFATREMVYLKVDKDIIKGN